MEQLNREEFLRWLAHDVASNLEAIIGTEEAAGYLSLVGDDMGRRIDDVFREERGEGPWPLEDVGEVLVELKRRIGGTFRVVESDERQLVFENSDCPFGDVVYGRPSLCMMTSNVFGRIAASHHAYAAVSLEETIARGDGRCVVRVCIDPDPAIDSLHPEAREYFGDPTPIALRSSGGGSERHP